MKRLLFTLFFCLPLIGNSAEVSLFLKNPSLKELISEIESQSELKFAYGNDIIIDTQLAGTYAFENEELTKMLKELSGRTPFVFRVLGNNIAITKDQPENNEKPNNVIIEQNIVKGKVIDAETGVPVPSANVIEKGTSNGVMSNFEGEFTIDVPEGAVLEISYLGYATTEVQVDGQTELEITLQPKASALDEVVVVGYGTQKKSDITGAVSSLNPEEFEDEPIANVAQGLQGKIAGVNVTSGNGAPGGNMIVRIRGNNSIIGSNDPLYVIDGVPMSGGTNILSTLNPSNIASMQILKDASATAIYGSRGSNGVIIITTRNGREGRDLVEIETSFGYREIENQLDMMNSRQFAEIANERNINDGLPVIFNQIDTLANINTNWQDEIFRHGLIQNHSITFSGGSEKTTYLISGNYFDEEGIIIGSDFLRGSVRLNIDQEISSKFEVSGRFYASRSVNNEIDANNILLSALQAPPFLTVRNPDGSYVNAATLKQYPFSPSTGDNPVALATERLNEYTADRLLTSLTGRYSLTDDLSLSVLLAADKLSSDRDGFTPRILEAGLPAGSAFKNFEKSTTFLNENTVNYNKEFGGIHSLDVVGGFTWQTEQSEFLTGASSGFVTDALQNNLLSAGVNFGAPSTGFTEWTLLSWLGRINYGLYDKYLFTVSGRADGSSRFGAGNKWGFFPSGAVAWKISEEEFIKEGFDELSNLKLRLSYGESGNQAISPYQSLQRFSDVGLAFGWSPVSGFAPSNLGNPDLRWETTKEFNAGLEVGLWQERLRMTADYYRKTTDDLLALVNLPPTSGYTTTIKNIGSTRNSGFELQVGVDIITTEKLYWDVSINGYRNVNVVTETAGGQDIIAPGIDILGSANIIREGEPLSAFYGLKTDGLTEDGLINYVDINNDGEITDEDRTILGSPYPEFFYGFNSGLSYGNFSLRVSLVGEAGKTLWNSNIYRHMNSFHRGANQLAVVATQRWTPENPDPNARFPKATSGLNQRPSDYYLEDASFLRIQNIRLNYNIPVDDWLLSGLKSASIYVTGQNLYTFTDYSWYTPDVNNFGSGDLRIGIDQRTYPSARTFMMGLKLGL